MELKEWLTAGTAVTGAVLGVFNLWRQVSADRTKLRVMPSLIVDWNASGVLSSSQIQVDPNNPPSMVRISVEVLNLSNFPVTVDEIGMTTASSNRIIFAGAHTKDNRHLPVRIDPRDSITLYTTAYRTEEFAIGHVVYADTVCGARQKGMSPAIENLKAAAHAIIARTNRQGV